MDLDVRFVYTPDARMRLLSSPRTPLPPDALLSNLERERRGRKRTWISVREPAQPLKPPGCASGDGQGVEEKKKEKNNHPKWVIGLTFDADSR
jgi:hypothetical protein